MMTIALVITSNKTLRMTSLLMVIAAVVNTREMTIMMGIWR